MKSHPFYGSQSRHVSSLVFCLQEKEIIPIHLINMQGTPVITQALTVPLFIWHFCYAHQYTCVWIVEMEINYQECETSFQVVVHGVQEIS